MNQLPQRKSPRLQGYDYSQSGAYFITICTHQRQQLFGKICEDEMILNNAGKIACEHWQAIPEHYPDIELDVFVVMPNHMHGIVCIITPLWFVVLYQGSVFQQIWIDSISDIHCGKNPTSLNDEALLLSFEAKNSQYHYEIYDEAFAKRLEDATQELLDEAPLRKKKTYEE